MWCGVSRLSVALPPKTSEEQSEGLQLESKLDTLLDMLARHLLLGVLAVCLSLAAADQRDDQLQTSQSTQLLSREKRG